MKDYAEETVFTQAEIQGAQPVREGILVTDSIAFETGLLPIVNLYELRGFWVQYDKDHRAYRFVEARRAQHRATVAKFSEWLPVA